MYLRHGTGQGGWKLGKIRGHEIRVSPIFLILIAIFVFMGLNSADAFFHQLMWAPVLFFSVLLHELGHAAATKYYGFGNSKIILHGLGGVAISRRGHTTPKQGMVIALAGPAVTILMALVSAGLLVGVQLAFGGEGQLSVFAYFLWLMVAANSFWFIFNLLPIFPMDGGQALMHFFRRRSSQGAALEKALKISLGTIIGAGALAMIVFGGGAFFILFIFAFLGYSNWKTLQQLRGGGRHP